MYLAGLIDCFGSGALVMLLMLEHVDIVILVLGVLIVHIGDWKLPFSFSLLCGHDVINVIHGDGGVVPLGCHMLKFARKSCPE